MSWPEKDDDRPERDVFAAHVSALPGSNGINPIAQMISELFATALRGANEQRSNSDKPPLPRLLSEGVPALTTTALGAVEGTLRSKGLDGALKEAQITALYAEARERNANASKLEVEAARERLALALDACRAIGMAPDVLLTPGGVPAIMLGAGLTVEPSAPGEAPQIGAGTVRPPEEPREG